MAKLKLTDKLCDDICNDIKAGVPIDHAAVAHGITRATFYNWYNKGEDAKSGKFKKFYDKVEEDFLVKNCDKRIFLSIILEEEE